MNAIHYLQLKRRLNLMSTLIVAIIQAIYKPICTNYKRRRFLNPTIELRSLLWQFAKILIQNPESIAYECSSPRENASPH